MESIWLALIVAIPAMLSPLLLSWLTNRHRREEKREDYARADAVEAKADKVAKLLLAANERVAETSKITQGKLDSIHTLVNSNLTAAKQAQLEALEAKLTVQREITSLKESSGHATDADTLADMQATSDKIKELKTELSDRLRQT